MLSGEEYNDKDIPRKRRGEMIRLRGQLTEVIADFVESDRGNRLPGSCRPIFDSPLVGFAHAADPIFARLQDEEVVGPHHLKPDEWLPGAATVISYFLPINVDINRRNYDVDHCSERWLYARFYGELFNERLRRRVVAFLRGLGYDACAPALMDRFASRNLSSNWSERHVAYAAGLGSFGLHAGLITDRGTSGRFGSIVTALDLQTANVPSGEPERHTSRCLWFSEGSCRACLKRCPAGALGPDGKDKARCQRHLQEMGHSVQRAYGFPYFPCGKCYVNVPCEQAIPHE